MSTFPALALASPLRQGLSLGEQPAAEAESHQNSLEPNDRACVSGGSVCPW